MDSSGANVCVCLPRRERKKWGKHSRIRLNRCTIPLRFEGEDSQSRHLVKQEVTDSREITINKLCTGATCSMTKKALYECDDAVCKHVLMLMQY